MAELQQQIRSEMQKALKERDELRLSVLRGVITSITNELVAKGRGPQGDMTDEEVIDVLRREVKKRREAAEQFKAGKRTDLAEIEVSELTILEPYLPQMASKEEIRTVTEMKMKELEMHPDNGSQKGALIGAVMKEMKGQANGGDVKAVVEEIFGAK
jgi:hypothetical protein